MNTDRAWVRVVLHARDCAKCEVILEDVDVQEPFDADELCRPGRRMFWQAVRADLEMRASA